MLHRATIIATLIMAMIFTAAETEELKIKSEVYRRFKEIKKIERYRHQTFYYHPSSIHIEKDYYYVPLDPAIYDL